jgi:6-phosphogluconolactonase
MVETCIGDFGTLAARLNTEVKAAAGRAAAERRRWSVAVSGGSVATTFFPQWGSQAPTDWGVSDVFWADERAVPPTDPDSNFGIARALWLAPAAVPDRSVHRMPAERPDLEGAAAAYAGDLQQTLGGRPLDLVLLGIGPDGHVASLFPGHPVLAEQSKAVAAVVDSPKPPPRRLTLTLPVLTAARVVVIAAFGAPKSGIVREAIQEPGSRLPAALVARGASRALWLLDAGAASALTQR